MENQLTLEDFLITHSKINKTFIYDFFMIQKIGKDSEYKPFIMDLELIAKWLDTGKKDLKDTLKASYIENVDYRVMGVNRNNLKKSKKSKNLGGRPYIKIYITSDCFKLLCMRSRTAKSEEVRKYYLELEKEEEDKSLCKNQDCSPIRDTKFTEKCSICSGYFADNGVNDIYFLSENGGVGSCNLCKKTQNVCIMKGTGQYVCVNACDEEEEEEETS